MDIQKKVALLQRLLEQSNEIHIHSSDDPTFKTWKNTVERTLIRIFGDNSPELKEFKALNFFYSASIMSLNRDYSNEHQQSFQDHFQITISSIKNYIEELEHFPDDDSVPLLSAKNIEIKKVFISHSSKDIQYVEELIECLETIGLSSRNIFCTSFEGYGIDLGDNFLETIKEKLSDDTLVLFVLTKNFYASPICLCEMGAAWVQSKEHIPILVPPFDFKNIQGVIPLTQGFKINEPLKLNLFKEKVEKLFELSPKSSVSTWERKRDQIITRLNKKIAEVINLS